MKEEVYDTVFVHVISGIWHYTLAFMYCLTACRSGKEYRRRQEK
jgi:hypothetical protein